MSDKVANQFADRLNEVLEDFKKYEGDESDQDTHTRALTVAFYPSFDYQPNELSEE